MVPVLGFLLQALVSLSWPRMGAVPGFTFGSNSCFLLVWTLGGSGNGLGEPFLTLLRETWTGFQHPAAAGSHPAAAGSEGVKQCLGAVSLCLSDCVSMSLDAFPSLSGFFQRWVRSEGLISTDNLLGFFLLKLHRALFGSVAGFRHLNHQPWPFF